GRAGGTGWFAVVVGTLQAPLRPEDHGSAVMPGLWVLRPGLIDHGPGRVLRTGSHHPGEEDRAFDLDRSLRLARNGAVARPIGTVALGLVHLSTARGDQLSDLDGVQGCPLAKVVTGQ